MTLNFRITLWGYEEKFFGLYFPRRHPGVRGEGGLATVLFYSVKAHGTRPLRRYRGFFLLSSSTIYITDKVATSGLLILMNIFTEILNLYFRTMISPQIHNDAHVKQRFPSTSN